MLAISNDVSVIFQMLKYVDVFRCSCRTGRRTCGSVRGNEMRLRSGRRRWRIRSMIWRWRLRRRPTIKKTKLDTSNSWRYIMTSNKTADKGFKMLDVDLVVKGLMTII